MTDEALAISLRDAQFLMGLYSLFTTLYNSRATEEHLAQNWTMLCELYARQYSANEANALGARLRALLPVDGALQLRFPEREPALPSFVQ